MLCVTCGYELSSSVETMLCDDCMALAENARNSGDIDAQLTRLCDIEIGAMAKKHQQELQSIRVMLRKICPQLAYMHYAHWRLHSVSVSLGDFGLTNTTLWAIGDYGFRKHDYNPNMLNFYCLIAEQWEFICAVLNVQDFVTAYLDATAQRDHWIRLTRSNYPKHNAVIVNDLAVGKIAILVRAGYQFSGAIGEGALLFTFKVE